MDIPSEKDFDGWKHFLIKKITDHTNIEILPENNVSVSDAVRGIQLNLISERDYLLDKELRVGKDEVKVELDIWRNDVWAHFTFAQELMKKSEPDLKSEIRKHLKSFGGYIATGAKPGRPALYITANILIMNFLNREIWPESRDELSDAISIAGKTVKGTTLVDALEYLKVDQLIRKNEAV